MRALGEAAWTARDLVAHFRVRDFHGTVYGHRRTEAEAVRLRDALGAEGVECWVETTEHPAEPGYIVDRDPGDEDDNREAPC